MQIVSWRRSNIWAFIAPITAFVRGNGKKLFPHRQSIQSPKNNNKAFIIDPRWAWGRFKATYRQSANCLQTRTCGSTYILAAKRASVRKTETIFARLLPGQKIVKVIIAIKMKLPSSCCVGSGFVRLWLKMSFLLCGGANEQLLRVMTMTTTCCQPEGNSFLMKIHNFLLLCGINWYRSVPQEKNWSGKLKLIPIRIWANSYRCWTSTIRSIGLSSV